MYYLAICAIVKNEAPYLEEWLEYHLLRGVEHFYIYENESTDSTLAILRRYETLGLITLHFVSGKGMQLFAYQDFINNYRKETRWIAFIDVDEFIGASIENLKEALSVYENFPAVALHWVLFGSNGKDKFEPELVIRRFIKRDLDTNQHIKTIAQTDFLLTVWRDPHTMRLLGQAVDENFRPLEQNYALSPHGTDNNLWIAHYITKSKEEAFSRWSYERADNGQLRTNVLEVFKAHDKNDTVDTRIAFYAESVDAAIEERRKQTC